MVEKLKRLNAAGLARFSEYIAGGALLPPPLDLLDSPETSEPLSRAIVPGTGLFNNRYDFGVYLNTLLRDLPAQEISNDTGLWSALALVWFDRICPLDSRGQRDVKEEYRYILSEDYRHYYRHLIRSPWQLVRDHGKHAQFLLVSPRDQTHPLSVHGEILEQFGGRQQVLASVPIIRAASRLYLDPATGKPRSGVAGSGRGSARRFGLVLRQLDLTYDPAAMSDEQFLDILPGEFERWKKALQAPSPISSVPDPNAPLFAPI